MCRGRLQHPILADVVDIVTRVVLPYKQPVVPPCKATLFYGLPGARKLFAGFRRRQFSVNLKYLVEFADYSDIAD